MIASMLPALSHKLPPNRKPWMSEDPRMALFEAAALGVASKDPALFLAAAFRAGDPALLAGYVPQMTRLLANKQDANAAANRQQRLGVGVFIRPGQEGMLLDVGPKLWVCYESPYRKAAHRRLGHLVGCWWFAGGG